MHTPTKHASMPVSVRARFLLSHHTNTTAVVYYRGGFERPPLKPPPPLFKLPPFCLRLVFRLPRRTTVTPHAFFRHTQEQRPPHGPLGLYHALLSPRRLHTRARCTFFGPPPPIPFLPRSFFDLPFVLETTGGIACALPLTRPLGYFAHHRRPILVATHHPRLSFVPPPLNSGH